MENLIVGPLGVTQIQNLVIIDGLDKCNNAHIFLSSLTEHMDGIPNVKFLITGRPVYAIASWLSGPVAKVFRLWDVERSSMDDVIKTFIRAWLQRHAEETHHTNPLEDWPSSDHMDETFDLARGSLTAAQVIAYQVGYTMPPSLDLKAVIQNTPWLVVVVSAWSGCWPDNGSSLVLILQPASFHLCFHPIVVEGS